MSYNEFENGIKVRKPRFPTRTFLVRSDKTQVSYTYLPGEERRNPGFLHVPSW